jgi:hypothetical protein
MTIVAINTMQTMTDQSYEDAVRQDILTAASLAQGYYNKHSMMGGGSNSFSNITLSHIQLDSVNENGSYSITNRTASSFIITGIPVEGPNIIVAEIYKDRLVWQ